MADIQTKPTEISTNQPVTSKTHVLKNILRSITEFTQGIQNNSHSSPDSGMSLLQWVLEDSDLRAGIEKKHSKLNEIGWFLAGDEAKVKTAMKRLKELKFSKWYADCWWPNLIYKNSFTEYGRESTGKITSLNLIETDEVEIVNSIKGKVISYLQIPTNPDGKENQIITISKDKAFHVSFDNMSTSLWGFSSLKTIIPTINKKRLLEDFIGWLIESNQFRSVIRIPSGVEEGDVETYLEMLKNGMLNPTNFLVVQGDEAQVTALRTFEGFEQLLKLYQSYQAKINKALQLPPLEMGNVESSNRSSSEYQVRYAYYSHLKYLLQRFAEQINEGLFVDLKLEGVTFIPKITDDQSINDLLDMAQKLLNMNADSKKLNKWLINQGLDIPQNLLKEPEELPLVPGAAPKPWVPSKKDSKLKLDKNSALHPSRKKTEVDFAGGSRKK